MAAATKAKAAPKAKAKKAAPKDDVVIENAAPAESIVEAVEKIQEEAVTLPAVRVEQQKKQESAIHNMKAHELGLRWGKETQKRNGLEIDYLRKALDIINNKAEINDVVDAYKEGGGDKATASRIKKIMTAAMDDPACRAVVMDKSSNSLQGAYQKIREIEKNTLKEALNDGEGDVTAALEAHGLHGLIPVGVDVKELVLKLNEVLEIVVHFDDKATKSIKAAIKSLEARAPKAPISDDEVVWPFQPHGQKQQSKYMGAAEVVQ